ncbi:hypothetical protein [Methanobacterium alcaliphilum]|uniref:hypothetical protein n=1 Tax=Methanobacterium alcaliphilum TaxID=392018 RepID=UPI00200B1F84|nr:hypothetical protein [Methanobacterium alcaliphilum]MCK9150592.1 hypothetical protein [Methanobacterium alcaliphilum]
MKKIIILSILILFFLGNGLFISQVDSNPTQSITKPITVKGITKSKLYPIFKEIKNIPYSNTLNCKNKSEIFAEYIYKQGYHNVKLLQVWNKNYSKGHQVVLFNGYIYDPTCGYYGIQKSAYLKMVNHYGLNGAVFTIDYKHNESIKLESFISHT